MANIMPLTANKVVVLRTLALGPAKWSVLRKEYFGPGRSEETASTSFYTQVKSMIGKGLVCKTANGYEITADGQASLDALIAQGFDVAGAKTAARIAYEAKNPIGIEAPVEAEAETVEAETVAA